MAKPKKKITAREFDKQAEEGKDMSEYFDLDKGTKRFNVDMPIWALRELDAEASRRGITRQSLVKNWLTDCLDRINKEKNASRVNAN